jgi:hypothetical protein
MTDDEREYLKEYRLLCEKFGMIVDSCGCCGSPWITPISDQKTIKDNIETLEDNL